jgi:subtilisin family serine protease
LGTRQAIVNTVDLPLRNVLEERERQRADARAQGDADAAEQADAPLLVRVHFTGNVAALTDGGFPLQEELAGVARAQLSPAQIRALDARDDVWLITQPQPAPLTLDRSVPEILAVDAWSVGAVDAAVGKGRNVVVGIVDTGIDVFHGAFRHPDGRTRILALWDQTFLYNPAGAPVDSAGGLLVGALQPTTETGAVATPARAPTRIAATLDYGIEFTRQQIQDALAAHPDGKNLPISLRDQPTSGGTHVVYHGTNVAGIAAGNGREKDKCTKPFTYVGVAPEADLVIVKTGVAGGQPNTIQNLPDAARYVFGVAAIPEPPALPLGRPAVVNISIGGHLGPHNVHDTDNQQFETMTSGGLARGRAIVVSAGNDRNLDLHAAFTIAPGATRTVRVNLTINSATLLRLWGCVNPLAALTCIVRMPSAGSVQQTPPQSVSTGTLNPAPTLGSNIVQVRPFLTAPADPDRHFFVDVAGQGSGTVTQGVWEFDFTAAPAPAAAANLHLWAAIPGGRSMTILPFPDAVPSVQDANRTIKRPAEWIGATMTTLASWPRGIAVGAYNAEASGTPLAEFSAQGPVPIGLAQGLYAAATAIPKPDVAAPGVAIDSARAEERRCSSCCECCVDRYLAEQGTSQAAPHITGVVALMFARDPTLSLDEIRTHLRNTARTPPALPPGWPAATDLWGAGPVNARAAVTAALRESTPAVVTDTPPHAVTEPERPPGIVPVSWPERLRAWNDVLDPHPAWHLCAALVSQHFDEVKRLIDTNRRVAALWRRHGGPGLVRGFVFADGIPDPPVPLGLSTGASRELLGRFLTVLLRFGGAELRADIARYAALAQALPGASWDDLDRFVARNGGSW